MPSPNVIFRFPLKYILVTENFCVYYCVCIEGIFKHQGHYKSIIAKTFKILSKKERTMCQSLGSVVGGGVVGGVVRDFRSTSKQKLGAGGQSPDFHRCI